MGWVTTVVFYNLNDSVIQLAHRVAVWITLEASSIYSTEKLGSSEPLAKVGGTAKAGAGRRVMENLSRDFRQLVLS